ncbi:hypothetical protein RHGRI_006495 [Rhododendron griersonianum]|nr:hypothetical protein RHGRI_006495 [Rhododendron griersonianum]
MEIMVSTIKNVLLDAQEREMSSRAVKEWLEKLELILYDASDLLDEVATETKTTQVETQNSLVRKVHYFFTSSNPLVFRYVMGRKIRDIGKRLDEIVLQMNAFKFVVKLVERPIQINRREETFSFANTPTIIGRDADKEKLVRRETYKMHDLVHDLAQYVAGNECLTIKGAIPEAIPDTIRHVSFGSNTYCTFPRPLMEAKKLRTIFYPVKIGPTFGSSIEPEIASFRCLRVLEGRDFDDSVSLPENIGKLKLLRYISRADNLPKSLCKLLSLQYLDLSESRVHKLPVDFWKLINLRFLCLSTTSTCLPKKGISRLTSLRTLFIYNCYNLTSLGEGIEHLSSLRELAIVRCYKLVSLPAGLRHLTSLEVLEIHSCESLNFSDDDDFKGLTSLNTLSLKDLRGLVSLPKGLQDAAATLTHLDILECLNFTSPSESVLPNLLSLQSLTIGECHKVESLPEGMQRLTKLLNLTIYSYNLNTSSYREVGKYEGLVRYALSLSLCVVESFGFLVLWCCCWCCGSCFHFHDSCSVRLAVPALL